MHRKKLFLLMLSSSLFLNVQYVSGKDDDDEGGRRKKEEVKKKEDTKENKDQPRDWIRQREEARPPQRREEARPPQRRDDDRPHQRVDWRDGQNRGGIKKVFPITPDTDQEDRTERRELRREEPVRARDDRRPLDGDRVEIKFSKDRVKEREERWSDRGKSWRRSFSDYRKRRHVFDDRYWDSFRGRHQNWGFRNDFFWSGKTASWPSVVVWLPWRWSQPVYYYYNEDGAIYYTDSYGNYVYVPPYRRDAFLSEAVALANSSRTVSRNQADWMSLGTFAIAQEGDSSEMPQEYLSLAISKNGALSGAYVNTANNLPVQIEGAVDERTQRVAWKFVGQTWPVMETGLYNLMKDESTVLIHNSRYRWEPKLLVRVD